MNIDWQGLLSTQDEIIVVEDDPTLRELMVKIIEEVGAMTLAFETADDALTYLLQSQNECRLVVVDHGVPGQIQGIEFIKMVREKWPTIAAILTSGYWIDSATVPPSVIYLHKPWSLDDLLEAIACVLQPALANQAT